MSSNRSFSITTLVAIALFAMITVQQCPNNDPYCSFCMGSQCVGCNGASLVNGVCVAPAQTTSNCLTYASDNVTCTSCNLGFFVSNGTCAQNPGLGCAVYSLAGGCTGCFNNVRAISGNCNATGTAIACADTNCDVCTSSGTCQYCARGYVLEGTNNTCMAYNQGYYGCLRSTGGVCTACRYGFYYRNNNCTGSSLIWTNSTNGNAISNGTTTNGIGRTAASLLFGTFVAFLFA